MIIKTSVEVNNIMASSENEGNEKYARGIGQRKLRPTVVVVVLAKALRGPTTPTNAFAFLECLCHAWNLLKTVLRSLSLHFVLPSLQVWGWALDSTSDYSSWTLLCPRVRGKTTSLHWQMQSGAFWFTQALLPEADSCKHIRTNLKTSLNLILLHWSRMTWFGTWFDFH